MAISLAEDFQLEGSARTKLRIMQLAGASGSQTQSKECVKKEGGKKEEGDDQGNQDKEGMERDQHPEGGEGKKESREEEEKRRKAAMEDYVKKRKFRFPHHFAGPLDPLGREISRCAAERGMTVEVI